ncbi:MAG: restriction endonuclease [Gammaproteobacteria bacterium]|nr:restriction endonuclease [Gammaproteobacteria bacterium]MYF27807.1 restriction endonuclease [Gammaproteobacteria bacterium]
MSVDYTNWQDYQQQAARVFRKLGCQAEVDRSLQGVRSSHRVDVLATFPQFGDECLWVVECKLRSRPVEKADVQTFLGVVHDVGAPSSSARADSSRAHSPQLQCDTNSMPLSPPPATQQCARGHHPT